jgi:hypothetical protein
VNAKVEGHGNMKLIAHYHFSPSKRSINISTSSLEMCMATQSSKKANDFNEHVNHANTRRHISVSAGTSVT